LLQGFGLGAAGLALSACQGAESGTGEGILKIGFVSPRTGPAASFGEPDSDVFLLARKKPAEGLTIGGTKYQVVVVDSDSRSNPQRSARVAHDLINSEGVDLMLTTSAPETVTPVSDACEAAGVPCISTVVPGQAWYFGRGAKPGQTDAYEYTFHFASASNSSTAPPRGLWSLVRVRLLPVGYHLRRDGPGD
jgi:branched-chain amino acid transport system substrate-binding protein